jgi:hypothetical protein
LRIIRFGQDLHNFEQVLALDVPVDRIFASEGFDYKKKDWIKTIDGVGGIIHRGAGRLVCKRKGDLVTKQSELLPTYSKKIGR